MSAVNATPVSIMGCLVPSISLAQSGQQLGCRVTAEHWNPRDPPSKVGLESQKHSAIAQCQMTTDSSILLLPTIVCAYYHVTELF